MPWVWLRRLPGELYRSSSTRILESGIYEGFDGQRLNRIASMELIIAYDDFVGAKPLRPLPPGFKYVASWGYA